MENSRMIWLKTLWVMLPVIWNGRTAVERHMPVPACWRMPRCESKLQVISAQDTLWVGGKTSPMVEALEVVPRKPWVHEFWMVTSEEATEGDGVTATEVIVGEIQNADMSV
ncbi:uncharacterized protein BJ171DRAFT_506234, partial [Polychytrium aggregatum]|uniref:uncharacterized protein n=1 Tax=Polychytrium aggregatum TaxID=110093 RepID=UPI0022FED4BC